MRRFPPPWTVEKIPGGFKAILAPKREVELTVVDTVPHAGTKVPKGSTVLITAYSRYAPFVVGLQLEQATAKLEAAGPPCGHRCLERAIARARQYGFLSGHTESRRQSYAQGLCSVLPGEGTPDLDSHSDYAA
jgi:hypothetical protein